MEEIASVTYLASDRFAVQIQRELFPAILVDFDLDLLALLFAVVDNIDICRVGKAEQSLLSEWGEMA